MADFGMNLLEHGGGVPNVFDSRIDDHSGTRSLSSLSDSSHGEPGDSFGGFLRGFVHQIVPRVSAGDYEYNAGMHSHVALPLSTGPHLSAQTPEFVPGELSMNGQYGATSSVASESQLPSSRYSGSTNIYVPQLTLDFTGENQQLFDQYSHFSTGMLANNQGQRLYQDLPGMGASFDHDIRAGVKMSDHYTAQQGWSTDIRSPTILKYHDRPYASTEHPSVPALHSSVEVSATVAAVKEAQGAKAASAVVNNAKVKKTNDAKSQHQPKVKTYPHQDRVTALKIRVPLEQFSASTHHTSSSEPSTSAVVSSTKSSATTKTVTRMTRNSVKASASQAPFTKTASKTKTRSANKKIVEKTVGCAGESPNATALDAAEESKSEAESEFEKKKKCYPDSIEAKKKKAGFDVRARKKHSDEAKKMGESVTITRLNGLTTISGVLWSALEYDITIPTTDEEFAALANEMLNAVNNFEGCKEVSTTKMFENRYGPNADHWTGTEKQAACTWVIVNTACSV